MVRSQNKWRSSRRKVLKSVAGSAVVGTAVASIGAKPVSGGLCKNDCESWPRTDGEDTQIKREEYGRTVKYYGSAGFYLEPEHTYFGGGKWHYDFRNEAAAGAVVEEHDGEKSKYQELHGDKHIRVEEKIKQVKSTLTTIVMLTGDML